MRRLLLLLTVLAGFSFIGTAQENPDVKKVYVIFKTHLDIGFTDLSSNVEQRYINEFIPKAINVAEQLKAEGKGENYVWTTGAWLVDAYLRQASPEAAERLRKALRDGDIVWNGVPYTVESESMNKDMYVTALKLSRKLDKEFGIKTIAAKFTDVPGHTRSIVPLLANAGIKFLHIGVNGASTVPGVPPICRWRDEATGKEIILAYQGSYGQDMILPDGTTAVSINFTGDNHGAHSIEQVKQIYARLRKDYPNAEITASNFNIVAEEIEPMRDDLPVVTSEIGDTWIFGYGSSPLRMARFRALNRLYSNWIKEGKIDPDSETAMDFAVRLGMIAEHTWGADVKTFLQNWDKYDYDAFVANRNTEPFQFMEKSWKELDNNIGLAIDILPENLRTEARKAISEIDNVSYKTVTSNDRDSRITDKGSYDFKVGKVNCRLGDFVYQCFSSKDYDRFQDAYLTHRYGWALADFGKPGLENSKSQSATVEAEMQGCEVNRSKKGTQIRCGLEFPENDKIDARILPENVTTEYNIAKNGKRIELTLTIHNKPANRIPEAYWLSFRPEGLEGVSAQKVGEMVDLTDVVEKGNRQMHGIDGYVDLIANNGTLRITSLDAPLLVVGERNGINYSTKEPDLNQGVHFCLFNNLWGTNFSMWWEGSIKYRFVIEAL